MNILILCTDYPTETAPYKIAWAHARSKHYLKNGYKVTVVNFSSKKNYTIDSVNVITRYDLNLSELNFDVVVSHSPNIRFHFPLLYKIRKLDKKIVIFFHGSESLYQNRDYSTPYYYMKSSFVTYFAREVYDYLKMKVIKNFVKTTKEIKIIFVSQWMKDKVCKNTGLSFNKIKNEIIHNCLSSSFYEKKYSPEDKFEADFVTLRKLDESKYAVDKVIEFAIANPDKKFHIFGRGEYFDHFKLPSNVEWFDYYINQDDLTKHLNKYKAALMPTRVDAQGVMSCEMAVYGIPLIVSDIFIMREMLNDFPNVDFIKLEDFNKPYANLPNFRVAAIAEEEKFSYRSTVEKELDVLSN